MSKAEKRACQYTGYCRNQSYTDFLKGYRQAEEDLKLTWQDINNIKLIIDQVESDYVEQDKKLYSKYFYQEVLKQFNEKRKK